MTGLQQAQKSPCYTSLYLFALATGSSSHQVQDTEHILEHTYSSEFILKCSKRVKKNKPQKVTNSDLTA